MIHRVNKVACFLLLCCLPQLGLGQIRKAELSLGAGYEHNFFKSPSEYYQADSFLSVIENGGFFFLDGEWDFRLEGGKFIKRNTQQHQVDVYTTLQTRQFHPLKDASSIYGDLQVDYRFYLSKNFRGLARGGLTHFITPEELKTPSRNILAYGFRRWEVEGGWEFTQKANHLSRLTVSFQDKDYTFRNSLDRQEYRIQAYIRQRFLDALGRRNYLRLETYFMKRSYDLSRGGGVDEEGFEIVAGKRILNQFQVELSFERELKEGVRLKPGFVYRYRDDQFPNRFGYQQFGPSLSIHWDRGIGSSMLHVGFLQRNYHNFPAIEGPREFLQKNYLFARWKGEIHFPYNKKILPFWDLGWDSRTTNNEQVNRIAFRGYKSWYAQLGLKVKWE